MRIVFAFWLTLLCANRALASSVIIIGPPPIAVDGAYADLSKFDEEQSYESSGSTGPSPFQAHANTNYSLNAYASMDWSIPVGPGSEALTLIAYAADLPEGMQVTFIDDYLQVAWQPPYVLQATDFTFECGVEVVDSSGRLEIVSRSVTVTVVPSIPELGTNAGYIGLRTRDAFFDLPYVELFDPDESVDGDQLRILNPDPRILFTKYEDPDFYWWQLEWNDAMPIPAVSELVPIRFQAFDFDGTGARSTAFERQLMIFGYSYEDHRIPAPDPLPEQNFGRSVELLEATESGPLTAFVADNGLRIQIYEKYGDDGWYFVQTLLNPTPGRDFGTSMSAARGILAVGAVGTDAEYPGTVFIYQRDGSGIWQIKQILLPDEAEHAQVFGGQVELTETYGPSVDLLTLMIAADGGQSNGAHTGAVWVYESTLPVIGNLFAKRQVIVPDDAEAYDYFGWPLALRGDVAALPANEDDDIDEDSGAVYVYRRDAGSGLWQLQQKLKASDADYGDLFGESVAISAQGIFIGAFRKWMDDTKVGAVYQFKEIDGIWQEQARIRSIEEQAVNRYLGYDYTAYWRTERYIERFGASLEADGNTLLIAGRRKGAYYLFGRSVVYQFEWDEAGEMWTEVRVLCGSDTDSEDVGRYGKAFGDFGALALRGDTILVGDGGSETDGVADSGVAYSFNRTPAAVVFDNPLESFLEDIGEQFPSLAAADDDADEDGNANSLEFFAGTNAEIANPPAYRIERVRSDADGSDRIRFVFQMDKRAALMTPVFETASSLDSGSWEILTVPYFLADEVHGDTILRRLDISGAGAPGEQCFIRMRLEP